MNVKISSIDNITKNHLISLYESILSNHDDMNANKIVDLYEKMNLEEFIISFSGHFSAGKSSIINYLVGMDVLPNSPIPTSANIVKISSGEGVARVFFKNETPVEYAEPYNIDMIKDYCMNKDTISHLEINTKEMILPKNSAILDTPGIDAADDADRLMTESSLHLVDELYYVMDYNHVQSEVNLYFLKEIQAQGIPIYIVINQVDKHNEQEITFTEFDKSVKQTFDQWKVRPEKVYYTSTLNDTGKHNQIKQLKKDLFIKLAEKKETKQRYTLAANQIIKAHAEFLYAEFENALSSYVETNIPSFDMEEYNLIQEELTNIKQSEKKLKSAFFNEVEMTLKNAYLMPAKLRDQASAFLMTEQKGFKVGFFNSKKKTAEAKQEKLDAFLSSLLETIQTTIQWKLKEKFVEILQAHDINEESLLQFAQSFSVTYGEVQLRALMKQGAMVNGNYILNYTNDVSADIKAKFRQAANQLWDKISNVQTSMVNKAILSLENKLKDFTNIDDYMLAEKNMQQELLKQTEKIESITLDPIVNEAILNEIDQHIVERNNVTRETVPILNTRTENKVENKAKVEKKSSEIKERSNQTTEQIIPMIDKTIAALQDMPAFDSLINDLTNKHSRLENRKLTIALFGAFSAGKSSFSNALFGEDVLPVSPNPTTAVISRISPVNHKYSHGTVVITCKDDTALTTDLKMITKDLSPEADNFTEMVDWIQRGHIQYNQTLSSMYQSYLLAVLKGYNDHKDLLGKTIEISLEEFAAYVTDESKACYIDTVDLYYDCAITRKGITLVDTPGADSVNARHTNVAFDYIKDADAILYVTYYNHAITSADRDFLMQLGRVKEAFELDKMFFIVNASDLAQSETDLQLVLNYVEEQLLQFGIRHPKIFPVSSKLSLMDKQKGNELNKEMLDFESAFYTFVDNDLAALTIESAKWDMHRATSMLANFIDTINLDENEQLKHTQALRDKQTLIIQVITNTRTEVSKKRIEERITRQLHYVLERVYIRFHDMFSQFFNPTTITNNGKKAQRELALNRNHFVDYVGYELLQESRAVSLRIEAYMKELLKETHNQLQQEINQIDNSFITPSLHELNLTTPKYEQAFDDLDMAVFDDALKLFKNMKSFFAQNDRENMKDAFYDVLRPFAEHYLEETKWIMNEAYEAQWAFEVSNMKEHIITEMNQLIENNIKLMTDSVDAVALQAKHDTIKTFLTQ